MVKWSYESIEDLKCIYDYIAKDSKYYADKVFEEFLEKAEKLIDYPEMGRSVSEIKEGNFRELIFYSYRLIYSVVKNDILIVTIVNSRKNFK